MEKSFWHERWEKNEIAFHERDANPLLVRYFGRLNVPVGGRVFLPLCGKTLDIGWLLSRGYRVAGAELSALAIEQLFAALHIKPTHSKVGALDHYSAPDIDIFVGDIFELSAGQLGAVDAIYDRAALVALPEDMRRRYAAHLMQITGRAPQLLVCYEYDQNAQAGPPFSVNAAEIERHYAEHYGIAPLSSESIPGGLKGKCPATENAWLLTAT